MPSEMEVAPPVHLLKKESKRSEETIEEIEKILKRDSRAQNVARHTSPAVRRPPCVARHTSPAKGRPPYIARPTLPALRCPPYVARRRRNTSKFWYLVEILKSG